MRKLTPNRATLVRIARDTVLKKQRPRRKGLGVLARQELKDRVDAMRPKIEKPAISEPVLTFKPSPPSPEAEISISELANELL